MGTRSGDGAVNDEFGSGEVRCVGADVVGVFNEVAPMVSRVRLGSDF